MTIAKTKIVNLFESRLATAVLLGLIAVLLGAYVYLVNNSVFNIVARETALEKASNYATELAVLESRYIELSGNITLSLAYTLGFADASAESVFVREGETARFSLADNEI